MTEYTFLIHLEQMEFHINNTRMLAKELDLLDCISNIFE